MVMCLVAWPTCAGPGLLVHGPGMLGQFGRPMGGLVWSCGSGMNWAGFCWLCMTQMGDTGPLGQYSSIVVSGLMDLSGLLLAGLSSLKGVGIFLLVSLTWNSALFLPIFELEAQPINPVSLNQVLEPIHQCHPTRCHLPFYYHHYGLLWQMHWSNTNSRGWWLAWSTCSLWLKSLAWWWMISKEEKLKTWAFYIMWTWNHVF